MNEQESPPAIPPPVAEAFDRFDDPTRTVLLSIRATLFAVAAEHSVTEGAYEYLAWGQPAYRPKRSGIGTAIRLGEHRPGRPALFVHCQTTLIREFRSCFGDMEYDGNRAVLLNLDCPLPNQQLRAMARLAFLYFDRRVAGGTHVATGLP